MELQAIKKSDHRLFVQNLIGNYRVEGVKKKEEAFFYGPIKSPEDLCLDFDSTIGSPKKYFLPAEEPLLRFTTFPSLDVSPVIDGNPFVLFGVHPYDLKAINQMDRVFADGLPDPPIPETEGSRPGYRS